MPHILIEEEKEVWIYVKRGSPGELDAGRGIARVYGSFAYGNSGNGIINNPNEVKDVISINNVLKNNFAKNSSNIVHQNLEIKDL